MALQTGLFTQGPSVDDILESRNKRSTDQQAQLMAQAAQGARDPARARAVSFLGSSLGRALGGAMGGQDDEVEQRQAEIAKQEKLQEMYGAYGSGTGAQQGQLAQALNKAGYYQEAATVANTAKGTLADEAQVVKDQQAEVDAQAQEAKQVVINNRLADTIEADLPVIAANVRDGDKDAIAAAYKYRQEKMKAKNSLNSSGKPDPTAAEQNYKALSEETKALNARAALPEDDEAYLNPAQLKEKMRVANNVFGGGESSYQKTMGTQQATQMGSLTAANNQELYTSADTRALIDNSLALINSGDLYTGAGGEAYLGLQKVLISLGAPVSVHGAAAGEAFRSNAMSFVLKYIAQTKGAISNAEMKKFEAAAMGLGKTELANRIILEVAQQTNTFRRERAVYMGEWFDAKGREEKYPTPNEYANEQRKWEDDNRIVPKTPSEIADLAAGNAVVLTDGTIETGSRSLQDLAKRGRAFNGAAQ